MNCDQVFQHLASAEPTSANRAIEQHLNSCSACRQMADLFRPAVRLLVADSLQGSNTAETGQQWPQVWEAVTVAERTASQLEQHVRQRTHFTDGPARLIGMVGILALGVILGAVCTRIPWVGGLADGTVTQGANAQGMPSRASECRFDRLLDRQLHAGLGEFCTKCRPRIEEELATVVTLCMVCHTRSGHGFSTSAGHEGGGQLSLEAVVASGQDPAVAAPLYD